jgi:hypothetical protein
MPGEPFDLTLPEALAEVFAIGFEWDYDDEADDAVGCDFEPYPAFEAPERTAWWFRLWTGNSEVTGEEFRFFGSTAAGDYAGFWLVRPGASLVEQPVVYIGSEGERGVIARDLGDLLWLFAAGLGPAEAFELHEGYPRISSEPRPSPSFHAIAQRYAPRPSSPSPARAATSGPPDALDALDPLACRDALDPARIVAAAQAQFPGFSDYIDSLCR